MRYGKFIVSAPLRELLNRLVGKVRKLAEIRLEISGSRLPSRASKIYGNEFRLSTVFKHRLKVSKSPQIVKKKGYPPLE